MPLLSTKCLKSKYKQEADYEIFTGKTLLWKTGVYIKIKGRNVCLYQKKVKCIKEYFIKTTEKDIFIFSNNFVKEFCQAFFNK